MSDLCKCAKCIDRWSSGSIWVETYVEEKRFFIYLPSKNERIEYFNRKSIPQSGTLVANSTHLEILPAICSICGKALYDFEILKKLLFIKLYSKNKATDLLLYIRQIYCIAAER